jgi:plastocyanin
MRSFRRTLLTGGSLIAAAMLAGVSAPHGIAQETVSLNVAIYQTNCFTLDGDPAYKLEPAVRQKGADARALPGVSESTIDVPLQELQSKSNAIVVTRSGKLKGLLACGEINSVTLPDGTVTVGLREQSDSTYGGLAVLSSNGSQTTVRAVVSGGLSQGMTAEGSAGGDVPVDDRTVVTVSDEGIEADQTTFTVGSRVEFVVTNDGTVPHEVMLENAGANESPLGDEEFQAETEDMAVGITLTFAYTFDEAGDYQLADHIGGNYLVLEITVE